MRNFLRLIIIAVIAVFVFVACATDEADYYAVLPTVAESSTQPPTQPETEPPTEPVTETATEAIPFKHVDIPILMYHTSSENNPGALAELYVRPSEFERQIVWLIENGFTFVTFDDWDYLHTIERPIMLTFDDGYIENYTEIFPILQRHNATIVLFLTWNSIVNHGFTEDMIMTMHNSGLASFESHSMTHPNLANISSNTDRLNFELSQSKNNIAELTGRAPIAIAYPAGGFNDIVKQHTAEHYRFGLTVIPGIHNTAWDDFEMRRVRINRSTTLDTFINLVSQ
ncbi:MAG: polysaccharide deacetylase family protein [Defluviitaleaceae bacterium]|nr:polysaccharide deacetylase family protein [Defluviitaleaceae bacterium]